MTTIKEQLVIMQAALGIKIYNNMADLRAQDDIDFTFPIVTNTVEQKIDTTLVRIFKVNYVSKGENIRKVAYLTTL